MTFFDGFDWSSDDPCDFRNSRSKSGTSEMNRYQKLLSEESSSDINPVPFHVEGIGRVFDMGNGQYYSDQFGRMTKDQVRQIIHTKSVVDRSLRPQIDFDKHEVRRRTIEESKDLEIEELRKRAAKWASDIEKTKNGLYAASNSLTQYKLENQSLKEELARVKKELAAERAINSEVVVRDKSGDTYEYIDTLEGK